MPGTQLIFPCLLVLVAPGLIAVAQQNTSVPQGARVKSGQVWFPNGGSVSTAYLDVSASGLQTITSLPYSAQLTIEDAQKSIQHAKVYRDGEGRTRADVAIVARSESANASLPSFIEIIDPVSGNRFMLDQRSKVAQRSVWPPSTEPGRAADVRTPLDTQHGGSQRADLHDKPHTAAKSSSTSAAPQISRESLGSKEMEGLSVQGSMIKTIYTSGFMGNKAPVAATSERWISPELKIVVMAKISDPRDGQTTFRLTGISRKEPDPSLFRVPEGYSIQ